MMKLRKMVGIAFVAMSLLIGLAVTSASPKRWGCQDVQTITVLCGYADRRESRQGQVNGCRVLRWGGVARRHPPSIGNTGPTADICPVGGLSADFV
jgi:hypothetical protein